MIKYSKILELNYSNKRWSISEDDYSSLDWMDSSPKPTQEELDNQWSTVQAYIDAHAYIAKRQQAYPSIAEQLDLIYHQGLDAWKSSIQAVKEEFPK